MVPPASHNHTGWDTLWPLSIVRWSSGPIGARPTATIASMTGIQPELWIDRAAAAVEFYQAAFGARTLHRIGEGDEIVAQLAIGDAAFWVSSGGPDGPRFSPKAIGGATGRTCR